MEDDRGGTTLDQGDRVVASYVDLVEAEPSCGASLGEIGQTSRRKVIDHVDLVTLGEEPIHEG